MVSMEGCSEDDVEPLLLLLSLLLLLALLAAAAGGAGGPHAGLDGIGIRSLAVPHPGQLPLGQLPAQRAHGIAPKGNRV
jgi:hypothetical protein